MKRLLPAGGILIFLALLLFFFVFFFGLKKTPQAPLPSMEDWADISLSRVSFVQSKNGVKAWELTAEQARLFEKNKMAVLKKISVVMKNKKGEAVTLSGEKGTMDMEGKIFLIQQEKHPVSIALGGYTIKTSELRFSSEDKTIESDKEIKIAGEGILMWGKGLKMFLDRSELTILGDVHAEVY
jgi:LPS export ABC transporter protein LptC